MGIKDFFKVKNPNSKKLMSECGKELELSRLTGKRVCVDASIMVYSAFLALKDINTMTDPEGKPTGHIKIILNKIIQLRREGIEQIWIFDSPNATELKEKTREERRSRGGFRMTGEHVQDIQFLLELCGIPYMVAPDELEAEHIGAFFTSGFPQERFCHYMMSQDSDVLVFGGNLLRQEKRKTNSSSKSVYVSYEQDDILNFLEMSREELVKMSVILGSDFAPRTPKVGPGTVCRKLGSIELSEKQKIAFEYFTQKVTVDIGILKMTQPRIEELESYLSGRGFNVERIRKGISLLEN